jgi:hypothetical protein
MLEQEIGNRLPFHILQPDCSRDKFPINEDAPCPSDRVNSDKRVDGCNGIFTHKTTGQPGMIDHARGGMFDFDSVQELLHGRGKAPVENAEWWSH